MEITRIMLAHITKVLPDGTEVALEETDAEFDHSLSINGKVECMYNTFDHAWEDFGAIVRCATLQQAKTVAFC